MTRKLLFTLTLCCAFLSLKAQTPDLSSNPDADSDSTLTRVLQYMKHAMVFNRTMPQEKVYLHFDNTAYFKNETMHFKAYVTRTDRQALTNISRVLYVELLNGSGDIVLKRKVKLENGLGNGDFALDSIFGSGFYEVRAFTRYMMNWGGVGAFSRVFPVFDQPKQDGDYSHPHITEYSFNHRLPARSDVQAAAQEATMTKKEKSAQKKLKGKGKVAFYPEGGDLVAGLASRVAFSITDEDGRKVQVKGLVVNAQDSILEMTETDVDGRGIFSITPDGQPLKLVVTDEQQKRQEFMLPDAKQEGCVLHLDTQNDIVARLYSSPTMEGRLLGYTIMNNGNVYTADTLKAEPAVEMTFERTNLPAGVNQITIFDSYGHIQAERLFFICPSSSEADSIKVSQPAYGMKPCGRIRLDLTAEPGSELSFSAMDAATLQNGKIGNARTWMLLGSEVRGFIENPDYYFEADDAEHRKAADLLMMVQGWRRYDWQLCAGSKKFEQLEGYTGKIQPIEDKLYVFGKLKPDTSKWRKKHPVDGVDLSAYLYLKTGEHMRGDCVTDSVGGYAFEMPDVDGEWTLQIKTKYEGKDARYVVSIDRHFSPAPRLLSPYETEMVPLPESLEQLKKEKLAQAADDDEKVQAEGRKHGNYVLPTVKVKGRYWTDNNKLPWYDEKTGARKSSIYYNVDEATDLINDLGEQLPTFCQWLKQKNPFFEGDDTFDDRYVVVNDTTGEMKSVMDGEVSSDTMGDYLHSVYKGGLTYKGRPILWIINNQYNTISHYPYLKFTINDTNGSGVQGPPDWIDEVKSVYISEDDDNYTKFIRSDDVERIHPITVYVYTHPQFTVAAKGLRRTHFQGFNVPTEFQMEDYSILPPMEDFRRTLFWAPRVQVGADGKAQVEFFNNSSCTQMYISAEGITPQGNFIINE